MSNMFSNCVSLSSFPDISKLNCKNIKDMSRMFVNCVSLSSLPDFSNWKADNILNIDLGCNSLLNNLDIKKSS